MSDLMLLSDAELDAVAGGWFGISHSFNGATIQVALASASQTNVAIDSGHQGVGGDQVVIAKNVNLGF